KDIGLPLSEVREELRPRARHLVKLSLLLGAIAEKEGLVVGAEEIDSHIEEIARQMEQPLERVQGLYGSPEGRSYLRQRMLEQKAGAWLAERAKFDTVMRSGVADAD
ncbi:MAG TPA: hypothetical protein VEB21_05625, partial [Terriglobales bacterium]|nr:hypothetical protein [Terriglobales bacterium]